MNNFDITSLESLTAFAEHLVQTAMPHKDRAYVITLSGDLGAGKTTLTQEVGTLLGSQDSINSPTYVIEQRYAISNSDFTQLVHIDAYRLEEKDDPYKIGLDQTLLDPTTLVIIEWPEKIENFLESYKKVEVVLNLDGDGRSAIIK